MIKILVPTIGQTAAAEIADYVVQIARSLSATIEALHVVRSGHSREPGELTLEYFSKAGKDNGVPVNCHFCEGPALHKIVDFAEENSVDLIVMGASRGSLLDQWISSDIRERTAIPVLVIPYQIFE